jgi:hypothetical protein
MVARDKAATGQPDERRGAPILPATGRTRRCALVASPFLSVGAVATAPTDEASEAVSTSGVDVVRADRLRKVEIVFGGLQTQHGMLLCTRGWRRFLCIPQSA